MEPTWTIILVGALALKMVRTAMFDMSGHLWTTGVADLLWSIRIWWGLNNGAYMDNDNGTDGNV